MQLELTGKNALVFGGSQGIGAASAEELALLGANVTVLARSKNKLEKVVDTLALSDAQQHDYMQVDMLDTEQLRAQMDQFISRKPAHIVVNNTGGPPGGTAHEASNDAYVKAFTQHLLATQTIMQCTLPSMQNAGFGRFVNIISTSIKEPIAGLGVSNTTRAAMAGWAKTLAGEIAAYGITVNNVLPGYTNTQRLANIISAKMSQSGQSEDKVRANLLANVPAKRFAEPHEVAAMVAFLCSPAAAYINGTSTAVDGGRTRALT